MTLIAGVRCMDGFLIAADSAVTAGEIVYHGGKLYMYQDDRCRVLTALCGNLAFAAMAWEQIRDKVANEHHPTISSIKNAIKEIIHAIYRNDVALFGEIHTNDELPDFSLIVGVQIDNDFKVFSTVATAVREIDDFEFQGTGSVVAQYLGETPLRSPGNSALTIPIAVAVHVIIEIFRVAKIHGVSVGLDTKLIAWRSAHGYASFTMPRQAMTSQPQSDIGIIQNQLRQALWEAFERSNLKGMWLDMALKNIESILRSIKEHSQQQGQNESQLTMYRISAESGLWSMNNIDPKITRPV